MAVDSIRALWADTPESVRVPWRALERLRNIEVGFSTLVCLDPLAIPGIVAVPSVKNTSGLVTSWRCVNLDLPVCRGQLGISSRRASRGKAQTVHSLRFELSALQNASATLPECERESRVF